MPCAFLSRTNTRTESSESVSIAWETFPYMSGMILSSIRLPVVPAISVKTLHCFVFVFVFVFNLNFLKKGGGNNVHGTQNDLCTGDLAS